MEGQASALPPFPPPHLIGDGVTECNAADAAAAALLMPPGYSLRGTMRVEKLDDMLDADVKVIKVSE